MYVCILECVCVWMDVRMCVCESERVLLCVSEGKHAVFAVFPSLLTPPPSGSHCAGLFSTMVLGGSSSAPNLQDYARAHRKKLTTSGFLDGMCRLAHTSCDEMNPYPYLIISIYFSHFFIYSFLFLLRSLFLFFNKGILEFALV